MVFLAMAVIVLVANVSAATEEITSQINVEVNDVYVSGDNVAIDAGQTAVIVVRFTADHNAEDLKIRAEVDGEKISEQNTVGPFVVEAGQEYRKTLRVKIPYELKDNVSDDLELNIKIWNSEYKSDDSYTLRVQRPAYNVNLMSVGTSSVFTAGEVYPVDIVLKNTGYSDLDDLYVTAKVPSLNIEKNGYFGDLVSLECKEDCDEAEDTVRGTIYLTVPYDATPGIYGLEVEVENDDIVESMTKQIVVENDFPEKVIATSTKKNVAKGEEAEFTLLIANPTNSLKVYEVVTENTKYLSSSADSNLVSVPAGSTRNVVITAESSEEGEQVFTTNFVTAGVVVESKQLTLDVEGTSVNVDSPVLWTIVLVIVLVVLLVILIVLLGRKPEKEEEFGESYY